MPNINFGTAEVNPWLYIHVATASSIEEIDVMLKYHNLVTYNCTDDLLIRDDFRSL